MYLCVWRDNICEFEKEWVQYLLPKETVYIEQDVKDNKYPNTPCIYITSFWHDFEVQLSEITHDYGIIYLSEEFVATKTDYFLNDNKCKFIWRNYVNPHYTNKDKITYFPCSYKNGFTEYIKENVQKIYTWSFAGAIHDNDRSYPLLVFKTNFDSYKIHATPAGTFNSDEGLSTKNYVKLIQESKYVICPPGKITMECSRLYETLEAGSVPITLANSRSLSFIPSYHHFVFPHTLGSELPFIIANDWDHAIEIVNGIEETGSYDKIQKECKVYWEKSKEYWKDKMINDFTKLITKNEFS